MVTTDDGISGNSSRALALRPVTSEVWQMIQVMAPVMHESRLFGVTAPASAAAIMLKGYELGLPFTASFEFIHIIQGKPSLSPRGALALIYQSGLLDGLRIQEQAESCTVWMRRRGGTEYELTWTLEDAKQAGLVKPDSGWQKYGPNMLRWRAIGFVADVLFPDVLGGLKRADEFGAVVNDQGDVIDMPAAQPGKSAPVLTLADLIDQYGADAVLAACAGCLPESLEQIEILAGILGAEVRDAEVASSEAEARTP